jgi:hypothetical protein
VLTWALAAGHYNPGEDFKEQEHRVFEFILQHPIPEEMVYPLGKVRLNLGAIVALRKMKNALRMREQRKGTNTRKSDKI